MQGSSFPSYSQVPNSPNLDDLPEGLDLRSMQAQAAIAAPDFLGAYATHGSYALAPHIRYTSEHLVKLAKGDIRHLMVFMPPRHSKSSLISQNFPAWYLGNFPDNRIILSSYEAEYAREWGRKARHLLDEVGPDLFGVRVSKTSGAAHRWDVEKRTKISTHDKTERDAEWTRAMGGMNTVGVGSGVTGRGANVLIIDDPVKDASQARSKTYQRSNLEWYRGTAYPRLESGGAVILLMTRWHVADLAGTLLEQDGRVEDGGQWHVIELPAIAGENDQLGRNPGEALWPYKFPIKELEDRRDNMTPLWWNAEYQQSPRPEEGGLFQQNWLRSYYPSYENGSEVFYLDDPQYPRRYLARDCYRIMTVDLAVSLKSTADYTCACVWHVTPDNDLLLEYVFRDRIAAPDQLPMVASLNKTYKPSTIGIEAVSYQISVVQHAVKQGLPVIALTPKGDKYTRAVPAAARMRSGKVYFKASAEWRGVVDEEILDFPNAKHDDIADNLSYAVDMTLNHSKPFGTTPVDENAYVSHSLSPLSYP